MNGTLVRLLISSLPLLRAQVDLSRCVLGHGTDIPPSPCAGALYTAFGGHAPVAKVSSAAFCVSARSCLGHTGLAAVVRTPRGLGRRFLVLSPSAVLGTALSMAPADTLACRLLRRVSSPPLGPQAKLTTISAPKVRPTKPAPRPAHSVRPRQPSA